MTTKHPPDLITAWETVADQLRDWGEMAQLAKLKAMTVRDKARFGQLEDALADAQFALHPCIFDFEDMVNAMEGATP